MSGILAMLKQGRFHPSDPSLFNAALSSVSAALSRHARSSAAATGFIRDKRRESLLAHATLPVPESQRRSLMTSPGNSGGLPRFRAISLFLAPCVGVALLRPLLLLLSLVLDFLLSLVAGRTASAPLLPPVLGAVSASGVARGRRLLLDLRVSGGRSHLLSGPYPAVVCPSIGRPGGTGMRSLGL